MRYRQEFVGGGYYILFYFSFPFCCFCCIAVTLFSFYFPDLYCILLYCMVCCMCLPEWRVNFIIFWRALNAYSKTQST